MERPSFQFYPEAWLADIALRACSSAARGLWIDMLCLMHQGTPYGHLRLRDSNGGYFQPDVPALARMTGNSPDEVRAWLAELDHVGVLSRTRSGTIFSKKMVRDERVRAKWRTRQARSRSKGKKEARNDRSEPCRSDAENVQVGEDFRAKGNNSVELDPRDVTGGVTPMSRGSPSSSPSSKDPKKRDSQNSQRSSQDGRSKGGTRRKAPPANPYPFTIYWNARYQGIQVEDPSVIVAHFRSWADQNERSGLNIRELLRKAQPSFERHALQHGYCNVSPSRLTVLFGKWFEKDILSANEKNLHGRAADVFEEALRKAEEEERGEQSGE